jgi:hypothetical protein
MVNNVIRPHNDNNRMYFQPMYSEHFARICLCYSILYMFLFVGQIILLCDFANMNGYDSCVSTFKYQCSHFCSVQIKIHNCHLKFNVSMLIFSTLFCVAVPSDLFPIKFCIMHFLYFHHLW